MLKRIYLLIVLIVVCACVGLTSLYFSQKAYFNASTLNQGDVLYELQRGQNLSHVLSSLEKDQIIPSSTHSWKRKLLVHYLSFTAPELLKPKAGTYAITPHMSIKSILVVLAKGKEHQFSLRLPEGKTFKDWMTILNAAPHLTHQLTGKTEAQIAKLLDIDKEKLEGLFLSDTYHYTTASSDLDMLKRAYKQMQVTLKQLWETREVSSYIKTPYDALILASIVEKETAQFNERSKVASVFMNRLKKGMRLQTDPTVIYGMGAQYKGNIRRTDLRTPTPYNTYVIYGLPPTPIAMPSKESIYASLHPDKTPYYYFVASGSGGHVFSRTYRQHNKAVHQFLQTLKAHKTQE